MAAQIYNTVKGAFEDAPTPQIYDASAQAYKDSMGLVYDTSKGAWDERWNKNQYLIRNGIDALSMHIIAYNSSSNSGLYSCAYTKETNAHLFEMRGNTYSSNAGYVTDDAVDLFPYKKLCARIDANLPTGETAIVIGKSNGNAGTWYDNAYNRGRFNSETPERISKVTVSDHILECDISEYNFSAYIGLFWCQYRNSNAYVRLYDMCFE